MAEVKVWVWASCFQIPGISECNWPLRVTRRRICIDTNSSFLIPTHNASHTNSPSMPCAPRQANRPLHLHYCCNWRENGLLLGEYFPEPWQSYPIAQWYISCIFGRQFTSNPAFSHLGLLICEVKLQPWTLSEMLWIHLRPQTLALKENGPWHLAGWAVIVIIVAWCSYGTLN